MDLSIVIVSWNTCDLLRDCLASIVADPPQPDWEVFVVDNASSDQSVAMVREQFPQVRLIENNANTGFASANNQAIRQTQGRYVLLLNPDTKILPGALTRLVDFMDSNSGAGGCGTRILNPNGSLQISCYPAPTLFRELWRLLHLDVVRSEGIYQMESWDTRVPREVDVLMGACLMVRRSAMDQVGLLDEDFFFTGEEVDWCTRLRQAGWRLFWVPDAQIIHYGGQSSKLVPTQSFLNLYKGKVLYFHKRHGSMSAAVYKSILVVSALARLAATPLALLEPPDKRKRHLTLAGNYARLLQTLTRI